MAWTPYLRTNGQQLSFRMGRKGSVLRKEMQRAARLGGHLLFTESIHQMTAGIYSIPVRTSSTGRPLWVRKGMSGGLISREKLIVDDVNFYLINRARYARRRHFYGLPGGDEAKAPQRAAPWRYLALRATRKPILALRREALRRGLAAE